ARRLGVSPRACAVVGDIGADVAAAEAAGATGVLVPNAATREAEAAAARWCFPDPAAAVRALLAPRAVESGGAR
ncbi:HAD hydrolase-like protein, partial [Streptomyces sp. SA3_actF]